MTNLEYRRRIFNECILECTTRIHNMILEDGEKQSDRYRSMSESMCRKFFTDELNLSNSVISATKHRLSESVSFIKDIIDVSEAIACDKAECAQKDGVEILNDDEVKLEPEDKELIDKLFEEKAPELQVDQIRDATVKALIAEEQKAQEVRDALSITNAQVASGADPKVMEETVNRIDKIGPTSLMNAIINNIASIAVKNVNENSGIEAIGSIGKVMEANADEIKTRAVMVYTLYEMASVFGIHKYTPAEVKQLSAEIYYRK